MKTTTGTLFVLFIFIFLAIVGCQNNDRQVQEAVRAVPVMEITTKDVALPAEYVAQVRALRNVEIRARVEGYLDEILVDEGSAVEAGQILFTINDQEYRHRYEQSKAVHQSTLAEARMAELEVERTRMLVDKEVISKTELDLSIVKYNSLKAKADEALSALRYAEFQLSHTKIRAPFRGIIDRIPFKKGSLIREGEMLTSVSDNSSVYAYFNVSETEYLRWMKDRSTGKSPVEISMELADGTEYPHRGTIETMAGEFNENTGSIAFRAHFPNPEGLLRHGSTATVVILNLQRNVVVLPQRATFEIQDKTFVFTVGNDNTVKMQSVLPKVRGEDFYVLQAGLKAGDRVVYEGVQFLKDGMVIQPELMTEENPISYHQDENVGHN